MTIDKKYSYLKRAFFAAIIYSGVGLYPFAVYMGKAWAAIGLIIIGFFLVLCSSLTYYSITALIENKDSNSKAAPQTLSVLSLLIWGFWTLGSMIDEPISGLIYFTPLFAIIFITVVFAFEKPNLPSADQTTVKK